MSLHSPSVLVTPPIRATQALEDKDATLEALMEDYTRATELQLSLKKRIEAAIREKEDQAEQEEEHARLVLLEAERRTARLKDANKLLKERMRKVEGIEEEENMCPSPVTVHSAQLCYGFARAPSPGVLNARASPSWFELHAHTPVMASPTPSVVHLPPSAPVSVHT
ncbi:hypothetical protein FRC19_006497 [Serendipita sp. 401]|nr:hypothetical protein FRC15_004031 [Serendipita sp. 397]KAG8828399.1 hypothetical protein FRC19_006497 [Serendipita sp. 401]KAG8865582.1 hypothetical protein FRC20_009683 [Serendipita sp. 405]KAG9058493.1 hypothetical protein FS842_008790 [Serendipita sp. 407]